MKKLLAYLLTFVMIFAVFPVNATSFEETETSVTDQTEPISIENTISSIQGIDANHALLGTEQIVGNVKSAVVYEANSSTLMYAWNPDVPMYPASLVKILTVLIAVETVSLTDLVTVSEQAISSVPADAVSAKLLPGEKLSVQDLLHCILLSSANDACVVIAEYVGGSEESFVDMMNQRAVELGCTSTHFTNPHGLHDDNQQTTARDSVKILAEAMRNQAFCDIFTADDYAIEKTNLSEFRRITSGNYMKDSSSKLYYDPRVIGGRTGVTQDGRRCLAAAAERNGMQLITVVMGCESVYQDDGYSAISIGGYKETTKLLDVCLDGYQTAQLLFENQSLRQIPISNGDCDLVIGPRASVSTVLPVNITKDDLVYRYDDKTLSLPIQPGDHVSDLQIWNGTMCVAQTEMYALNAVNVVTNGYAQDSNDENGGVTWPIGLIMCVVIITAVFVILRYAKKIRLLARRKRSRRYSRDRRRNR